jgi:hypothetical protein
MAIIKLKVSEKILDKFLWLLGQFKNEDLQIVEGDEKYESDQKYAQEQLNKLESGKDKTYSLKEAEELLEQTIRKNED